MEQQNYINSVNLNKNTNFPYLVLDVVDDNSYPRNPGFQVMHWHEDLQFIAVLSGEAKVVTLEKSVLLHSGEGAFINKNVVHLVRKNGSCHYKSFVFPDFFLKFYTDCPANRIVEQWAGKENFPFFHIENREEHRKVLALLQKLSNLGRQETPFYAYEVLTMLPALWLARISWLVAHHHTYTNVDGLDHQILLEADFLVNAGESGYTQPAIQHFRECVFRTAAGTALLDSMYLRGAENP